MIHNIIRDLNRKLDELLGRQELVLSKVTTFTQGGQIAQQGGQQQQVGFTHRISAMALITFPNIIFNIIWYCFYNKIMIINEVFKHIVDALSYFSFQPVLHDWCNKGRGMWDGA